MRHLHEYHYLLQNMNVSSYVLVENIWEVLNWLSAQVENWHTLNFRHVTHVLIRRNPMKLWGLFFSKQKLKEGTPFFGAHFFWDTNLARYRQKLKNSITLTYLKIITNWTKCFEIDAKFYDEKMSQNDMGLFKPKF